MKDTYQGKQTFNSSPFSKEALELLKECAENDLQYQMLRNLLDIENQYRAKGNRRGVNAELKEQARKDAYTNSDEALEELKKRETLIETLEIE